MSNKAVFLDRDDTLLDDPGYINHPNQVKLLPGVTDSLKLLRKMGYKLIIVTNQSAIARGIVNLDTLEQIHTHLHQLLKRDGASVDAIYFCPYHPQGVIAEYRKDSEMRKPNPGMLLEAAKEHNIDLAQSWMVGDKYDDVAAGQKAGCKTILIKNSAKPVYKKLGDPMPDKEAGSIREAVNIIKMIDNKLASSQDKTAEQVLVETSPEKQKPRELHRPLESRLMESKTSPAPPPAATHVQDKAPASRSDKISRVERTHHMLEEVIKHLEGIRRDDMFAEEFSIMKFFAGILQIIVVGCIMMSLWFLMNPTYEITAVYTVLFYALVLQTMALTYYIMKN